MTQIREQHRRNKNGNETETDLPAPAIPDDTPFLDAWVAGLELVHDALDLFDRLGWRGGGLEELAQFLALLVRVRWVPGDVGGLALEEVRHENAILVLLVGVRENVGALESLREEAEDVVDDQDALTGR